MRVILFLALFLVPILSFTQAIKWESKDSLNGKPKRALTFGGYINSIFYYDFVGYEGQYPALNIVSIPVGDVLKEPSTNFVVFQTRLRFNLDQETKLGTLKVKFEGDFINSANAFRIRHALISLNRWDLGQTWSNFSDEDAWPNMTDYDGPPTGVWARPTMIRFHAIKGKFNTLSLSLEGPSLDYRTHHTIDSAVSTAYQDIPDFTLRYRYENENFHIQVAGVFRYIKYKNIIDSTFNYKPGYGISASTGITLFQRDRLHAQATVGRGISRYLVGFEGYNWDAVPTGKGTIELVPALGGFIGYDHYWDKNKKYSSTAVLGYINIKNDVLPLPGDFITGYWGLVNFYWHPIPQLNIALEYVAAYREDAYQENGNGARIQLMAQYNF